jgi:hypothetical protein
MADEPPLSREERLRGGLKVCLILARNLANAAQGFRI